MPGLVEGDPGRFRQVISNLVGNALKFTERGGVRVTLRAPAAGRLAVTVRDTGAGITEDVRSLLVHPFSQGDTSTTRRFGGSGLGLVICQQLARLMGGDVRLIESGPGGSTFEFTAAARAAGMDGFLTKPIRLEDLAEALRRYAA